MFDFNGQNHPRPQFPRRLLRLLSMGCGISKFNLKTDDDEATCIHNHAPNSCTKGACCLATESKPLMARGGAVFPPEDPSVKGEAPETAEEREEEGVDTVRELLKVNEGGKNSEVEACGEEDNNCCNNNYSSKVCRGGSPSFREYCMDIDSIPISIKLTEDDDDGAKDIKCPTNEENSILEKGPEEQIGKKERRGRSFMNALQRGRPGGVRSLLHTSRRNQQQQQQQPGLPAPDPIPNDASSAPKLLAPPPPTHTLV